MFSVLRFFRLRQPLAFFSLGLTGAVAVSFGQPVPIDVPLHAGGENVFRMEAFTISADIVEGSGLGLIAARQKAFALSDAISSEDFGRMGVGNAAEALGKVTGASVVDGKYVFIRGLGDRYSNTLLNNVAVPTADPDRRAVQMDQFPSDLIESIVTTKSFTPNQPGSFSGGSVNVRTKTFPEQFFVSFGTSLSMDTNVQGEDVLTLPGGERDWTAMDDGTRDLPTVPAALPSRRAAEIRVRQGDVGPARELDQATRLFDNRRYYPGTESGDIESGFSFAMGDRWEWDDARLLGYTVSLTYDRDTSHYEDGIAAKYAGTFDNVIPLLVYSPERGALSFDQNDAPAATPAFGVAETSHNVNWGAFAKLSFRPVLDHEVSLDLFHNQSATDRIRRGVGEEVENYAGGIYEAYDLLYTERSITSAQLSGSSLFIGRRDLTLDWRVAHSVSTQDQPDYRALAWVYDLDSVDINATIAQPNRLFRYLEEDSSEAALDLTIPFQHAQGEGRLKFGGLFSDGARDYDEYRYSWSLRPRSREALVNFPGEVGIVEETDTGVVFGNTIERQEEPNRYTAGQEVAAGYAMYDWPLTASFRVIAGVRVESTEIETVPVKLPGRNIEDARLDEVEWLPALSVVFAQSPHVNFRAAYGRTLARPTFKELADIRYEDVFLDVVYSGNPGLQLTTIDNFDLRWEWFPRRGEIVAVSAFYKSLKNPIEVVFSSAVGAIQPQNADKAEVYGVEFEFRRGLGFLGPWGEAFSFGANLALMDSAATIPADELALIRQYDPGASDTRELLGQSPYTFNVDLNYDRPASGTGVTLSFGVVGERLDLVQYGPLGDVYEQPAPDLTLTISQRLGSRWRARLTAQNLLQPDREKTFSSADGDIVFERYRAGLSVGISLSYLFE